MLVSSVLNYKWYCLLSYMAFVVNISEMRATDVLAANPRPIVLIPKVDMGMHFIAVFVTFFQSIWKIVNLLLV